MCQTTERGAHQLGLAVGRVLACAIRIRLRKVRQRDVGESERGTDHRDQAGADVVSRLVYLETRDLDDSADSTPDETSRDEVKLGFGAKVGTGGAGEQNRGCHETTDHGESAASQRRGKASSSLLQAENEDQQVWQLVIDTVKWKFPLLLCEKWYVGNEQGGIVLESASAAEGTNSRNLRTKHPCS